ncbi:lipopolysaccharide biosynthesis protein [Microbacterium sorbitolivorans]|uniref:Lipopolysaccharide biosynthesis protein n=1 Tax=Microbacterium sorbitolivorans TaxID=1867410 RepID=A0A367Y1G3_9MICO|nr:lipopolysaccharide biosynthesis protein [Microbacterium sorbitolivorans]RCK59694.1 lipopolysaccharide biosynthesis protein [Microbacterium sorbitolivorans]
MSSQAPRAPRGARILMLAQVAKAGTLFLGVIFLSRLLSPTEFGLVAVPISLVGIGEILRDMGLSTAATTHPNLSNAVRDVLFWLNVAIAVALSIIVIVIAPILAGIFDNPAISEVLPWLCIVFLANGLAAQYRADLTRRMKFGAMALADSAGSLGGVFAAIIGAYLGASYWALIIQQATNAALVMLILIAAGRWIPKLPTRTGEARGILRFGINVSVSQALIYAGNNVDTLALGYWSGSRQLGYYTRSFQLSVQPFVLLKQPANSVALPLLSRRAAAGSGLLSAALLGQKIVAYTIVPAALLLAACSGPLVVILLGEQWVSAVPIVSLLAIASAIQQVVSVSNWLMLATHAGATLRRYSLVSLVIKVIAILLTAPHGPVATATGYLVAAAVSSPLALWWACRAAHVSLVDVFKSMSRPVVVGTLATISGLLASAATIGFSLAVWTTASCVAFLLVYVAALSIKPVRRDLQDVISVLLRRSR